MQDLHRISRRSALHAFALLPAAAAVASQKASLSDDGRAVWNRVYTHEIASLAPYPNRFLAEVVQGRKPGRALDVGMGQGRNSLFLARLGWDVTGVDISDQGIDIAQKEAARLGLKIHCVLADIAAFDVGRTKWDLIVGVYMGRLILLEASHLTRGLTSEGLMVVEHFRRDVGRLSLSDGQLGYPVNALLETFVPSLRIVRYEEVLDFPDWGDQGERAPLVRMLARKG
jgi:SAM-dependent methyltransferase